MPACARNLFVLLLVASRAWAWDYANHRLLSELAIASLPADFPAFTKTSNAIERIAFLSGEADRWRNSPDLPLRHLNHPDHFFDFEYVEELGLDPAKLSPFRYTFTDQLFTAHAKAGSKIKLGGSAGEAEQTTLLIGFLPWAITEQYAKLKSSFSYLKTMQEFGSAEEIENAQANVIYNMGFLAHFPGDGSQPLHTTKHYNGWIGENPNRFTTNGYLHAWIDGGFLALHPPDRTAMRARVRPAQSLWNNGPREERADIFQETVNWLRAQHVEVRPLYEREKQRAFGNGDTKAGVMFLEKQLLSGAHYLGDLWFTAWKEAQPDRYLIQYYRSQRAKAQNPPAP